MCGAWGREEWLRWKGDVIKVSRLVYTSNENGGSGIICREGKAAGGHCPGHRGIRPAEKGGAEFSRAVPVSFGKIAVVQRASDQNDLPLLWMRARRRCF